jgi:16S rRNA (cytidine1402-2'-O)-methyltransferase
MVILSLNFLSQNLLVSQFSFLGFLPVKGSARDTILQNMRSTLHPLVFFEAPHRILKTMTELQNLGSGDRCCVCCRELSKVYEEIWRGTVSEAVSWLSRGDQMNESRIRGEFTVIFGPSASKGPTKDEAKKRISSYLKKLESDGISRSEAVSLVSEKASSLLEGEWECKKSDVYKIALKLKWKESNKDI